MFPANVGLSFDLQEIVHCNFITRRNIDRKVYIKIECGFYEEKDNC